MEREVPDRLYIRKDDKKHFKRLLEKDSPWADKDNKDVFLMAMVVGFHQKCRTELDRREGFVRTEYLDDKEKALIGALAVHEAKDLGVLLDMKKVFSIAEEYAAGGVKLLKDSVFSGEWGSYVKRFESELLDVFESIRGEMEVQ